MKQTIVRYIFFFSLSVFWNFSHAQGLNQPTASDSVITTPDCQQLDIFDVLTRKKLKVPEIPSRKIRAIIIPMVAYTPATGMQFGAGSSLSWTIGRHPRTNLSAGSVQVLWTTERQLISYLRTNMFFNDNRWALQTDWRWYLFRLPARGLGTGADNNIPLLLEYPNTINDPVIYEGGKFPMKYNWIKFHNILSMEVSKHYYAGLGYHFDYYYDILDIKLQTDSAVKIMTPHFVYSRLHGFNPLKYITSGVSLNFAYDTRDNIINAYKGIYFNASYLYNFEFMGSDRNGSNLWVEFRTYVGLSKRVPRNLLAFWVFGSFKINGDLPYLNLMANGFDKKISSGRGYPQGRWRGEDFAYGELEYRFPISRCSGIIGGVLFANVTTSSNRDMQVPLFGYLKPGCGFGVRIMVGKYDRTNILIDFGLGQLSRGLYIQAQETF
ncbi:MAG: BamA/TamA family outer membrane protein [Bacteroidales bacterium]|nr:BamA/TamA family outer membrane protein [Bacteroidales bacterium]